MKKELRQNIRNVAANYEGREETRRQTTLIAETMFGTSLLSCGPTSPLSMRRDIISVHEIILIRTEPTYARLDKELAKVGFRSDFLTADVKQYAQYATMYLQEMERHVNWASTIDAMQEYGPPECAFIPVYLDPLGARVLVYAQTSSVHNAVQVAELRDEFLAKEMPGYFKPHHMIVEAVNEIYSRKEK